MTTALLQQPSLTRTYSIGNGAHGPADMNGYTAFQASEIAVPKNLEDGAMVVMYSAPGDLVIVRPNGKYWDLEAISTTEETEELTLQFFPSLAVFTVVKKGKYLGFKSLGADGRTLQAVSADDSVPHRVNNYNFGHWESWEAAGTTFINKKWPQRSLGMEVREIQAVAVEDLRRLERHNLRMSRDKQKQVQTLELKLQDIKRQLQEQSRARKRMTIQHQRELEDSRSRLEEALRAKQRLEVDAVQTGARLKQKELQFQQLTLQRDTAEAALEQKESHQRAHEREIQILREKHENEINAAKRQHRNEVEALKRDREHEMGRSTKHANGEVHLMQQKLEQTVEDKDRELRRVCVEHQHAIQQKVNEINHLRDENQRLTMALQTIREQLTRGFVAYNSSEMAPSRAGTERSLDLPASSFNRFSPSLSRASTGRRLEDSAEYDRLGLQGEAITPRRCSLPCAPTSPYGRASPAHGRLSPAHGRLSPAHGRLSPATSPEPYLPRSSGEYRPPRRGDSRLSDNTGLGRMSDEIPPLYRGRVGHGLTRRHVDPLNSARYSSQLDSVEDTISKASEYQASERDDASPRPPVEKQNKIETQESDDTSVDCEEPVPVENTTKADPTDVISTTDESETSETPKSWVGNVAPIGESALPSDSDSESDKDMKLDD